LLAAALSLFATNGFDATTVDEIARHAGVAVGGFYLHFRSKRQVLQVLVDSLLSELDARLGALDDPARLPEQLLTVTFDSPYAGVYRAWREAVLRDPSIAALDAKIEAWMSARIAASLHAATLRTAARASVDLRSVAWMLSVLWQQLLEDARPDRNAVTKKAAALMQSILFEDVPPPSDTQPVPGQAT
jgi:AcrR family transcriptional regulator